jgi:hypothetical protein
MTTVSFYTTDVSFYAVGVGLRGLDPILLHEGPTAEFLVTLTLALVLAGRRIGGRNGALAALAAFILMGLPTRREAPEILLGAFHAGMMMHVFLAYVAIDTRKPESSPLPLWRLVLFTLALAAAVIADTMAVYMAILPFVAIGVWRIVSKREARRNDVAITIGAVLGLILAKTFLSVVQKLGGFTFNPLSSITTLAFVPFSGLPQNISWAIEGLLTICGANFFGQPLNAATLVSMLNGIPLGFSFWAMTTTLRRMLRRDTGVDRIAETLAASMLLTLVAYVISTLPVGLFTVRYFVPFLFMGAVLSARLIGAMVPGKNKYGVYAVLALSFVVGAIHIAHQMKLPPAEQPTRALGQWLEAHGLKRGYGNYWAGAATTVYARGRVRVLPIQQVDGKVVAFLWGLDQEWYRDPMNFVVTTDKVPGDGNTGDIDESAVFHTFGSDAAIYHVNGYTVYVYSHNLPSIVKPLSPVP